MSEKRFELRNYGNEEEIQEIIDKQGKSLLTWEDVCEKLNELVEENEQLKEDNEQWERSANMKFIKGSTEIGRLNEKIAHLQNENEQLKAKASSWKITASQEGVEKAELVKQICDLRKENEQLRQAKEKLDEKIIRLSHHMNRFAGTNDYAEKLDELEKDNEELKKILKHWVFVDVDNQRGCKNCKHELGSICEILECGTHGWLDGVSECGLEYWESVLE